MPRRHAVRSDAPVVQSPETRMDGSSSAPTILIIGYGNSLRRDDGAGLVLAQRLAQRLRAAGHSIRLLQEHQLTPELALEIAEDDICTVLFCDATVAATPAQGVARPLVRRLDPAGADVTGSPAAGHAMEPGLLLVYAAELYGRRPPAWLLTVVGSDFAHGSGLSLRVEAALDHLDEVVAALQGEPAVPPVSR